MIKYRKITLWFVMSVLVVTAVMPVAPVSAACANKAPLAGMRSWNAGLPCEGNGENEVIKWSYGKGDSAAAAGLSQIIWTIVLNVVASVLALVGYVVVGMIIYGGFLYISSAGDASKVERGKKIIMRAVIGLIIVLLARSIIEIFVNVISGDIGSI